MTKQRAWFVRDLLLALCAYVLLVVASQVLLRSTAIDGLARAAIALAPAVADLFAIRAVLHAFRGMDELQQRIQLEALAIAAVATAFVCVSYGLVESAGFERLSWLWVAPIMAGCWLAGLVYASRHYHQP